MSHLSVFCFYYYVQFTLNSNICISMYQQHVYFFQTQHLSSIAVFCTIYLLCSYSFKINKDKPLAGCLVTVNAAFGLTCPGHSPHVVGLVWLQGNQLPCSVKLALRHYAFSQGLGWNLNSAVRVEACFSMLGQPKSVLTATRTLPHSYERDHCCKPGEGVDGY